MVFMQDKTISLKHKSNILLVILAILAIISISRGFQNAVRENGSGDFQWQPAKALLERDSPFINYLKYLDGQIKQKPYFLAQTPNYPITGYVLLWPYALFNWNIAKLLWAISNILFTTILLWGLFKLFPLKNKEYFILCSSLFFISLPFRNLIGNGQHGLFSLAFFMLALISMNRNALLSGLFLSMSWFKFTLTFPLSLFFIYKRQFRPLIYAVLIQLCLLIIITGWTGIFTLELVKQNIIAMLHLSNSGNFDLINLITKIGLPGSIGFMLILILVIGTIFRMYRISQGNDLKILSFLSLLSFAIFFHRWYDFVVLIFPFWWLFLEEIPKQLKWILVTLFFLVWYFAKVAFEINPIAEKFLHFSINMVNLNFSIFIFYITFLMLSIYIFMNPRYRMYRMILGNFSNIFE